MEHEECPFKWGDRVSHKLFGFATVNGEPTAVSGTDATLRRTVPRGWTVPVEWDDKGRAPTRIVSDHLTKISSPDAKGVQYWHHEWQKRVNVLAELRRKTDAAMSKSFRSTPSITCDDLTELFAQEQTASKDLLEFLRQDADGEHQ
ncbi:hypothetical protein [Bradyrhizobium sp. DASA03007]|uniref:hypothetical protein n=1 Tax=unclassified Bradyrhizobium TaxID=2631580 RepID=UPI003F71D9DE